MRVIPFDNMKLFLKILKITAMLIVPVLAVLFSISLIMQNKVADMILKSLNRNFSTKIETGSYHLSLIKKFPKATIELKNVLVHSSPGFDKTGFAGINTDTLLSAKSAFLDFKMTDLLKGDYTFTSISIRSGKLNLFTDTASRDNYDVNNGSSGKGGKGSSLNLNRVNLSDVRAVYNDLNAGLIIKSTIRNGRIKSKIYGDNIDFESTSNMVFEYFSLGKLIIKQSIPADVEVGLSKNEKGVFFRKSTMSIETWDFILTGFIAADNYLDLNVSGKNIDISKVTNYFPGKYKDLVSEYHPSGILKLESTIKGISSRTRDPHYEVTWSLKNANIDNKKSRLKAERFSFDGSYSNGIRNSPGTSTFTINNFTTKLGSANYNGSFTLWDFTRPRAELIFKGVLYPSELKEFLNLQNVQSAGGSVDLNLRLDGYLDKKDKYDVSDILSLNQHSAVVFKSFGMKLKNQNVDLRDVNGQISLNENTSANNFSLIFNDQRINLSGSLVNFPEWLAGQPCILSGSANISAACIRPESFMRTSSTADKKTGTDQRRSPVTFPSNVSLDIDFDIDTLIYKTFWSENIAGSLSLKPKIVNIKNVKLNSQKGMISGNGLIMQNSNKSFIGRGNFSLTGIDINETFTTFHNFGQNFLKAENINGELSGSLSLLIPVDSMLYPDVKSITAEGKYILTDGALINFDPVKALSSFIELSELQNIKFDQLENDFFIRNNSLYMPQMDVRSSAVDLSVNGKHGFNNDYQYHVKMLLSELLSKKARKKKPESSEFGEIEDDGLGRTSILLKIDGKGENVKVSYDMQAAGAQIRDDIKKERQTLKKIWNEEYGSGRSDPETPKTRTGKPRFRITWEGSDTTTYEKDRPVVKNEGILKKLFKKKL